LNFSVSSAVASVDLLINFFFQEQNWLDDRTSAVFIEFSVFNPTIKMFTVVSLVFERSAVGVISPWISKLETVKLYALTSLNDLYILVFQIIYVIFIIVYTVNLAKVALQRSDYMSRWETTMYIAKKKFLDVLIILLSIAAIVIYIFKIVVVELAVRAFKENQLSGFVNWYDAALLCMLYNIMQGACLTVALLNLIYLVGLKRRMFIILTALQRSINPLMSICVFIGLGILMMIVMGNVWFGAACEDFSTTTKCALTVFNLMLRKLRFSSVLCSIDMRLTACTYVVLVSGTIIAVWIPLVQTVIISGLSQTK